MTFNAALRLIAGPYVSTALRFTLGAIWIYAGAVKVSDLNQSVRAVRAYRLLPETAAQIIGAGLPLVEVVLGALLIAGVAVRVSAGLSALLQVVFIIGVTSAAVRGLRIDCGCFGGGGDLTADQSPQYTWEIIRDSLLFLASTWLVIRPATKWSVEKLFTRRQISEGGPS